MKRAIRCTGYVIAGIGIAAVGMVAAFAIVGILFWLSDAAANYFSLPNKYSMLFFLGFLAIGAGGIIGASICQESQP